MDARERALMRASVALGLLVSTLKKHDLGAPLSLDDPLLRSMLAQLQENLREAEANHAVSSAMAPLNKAFAQGTLLNASNVGTLLNHLKKVDALLKDAGHSAPAMSA
ncbi:hypothetical protein [Pseudomonas gingeri]|uniref:hypothetical protein n=1 Tax=Pseudomonas gingeri TaxID=117681 RepID=UPI001FE5C9B4|nr:hypothetical protein [Pseudomonas gingeri]